MYTTDWENLAFVRNNLCMHLVATTLLHNNTRKQKNLCICSDIDDFLHDLDLESQRFAKSLSAYHSPSFGRHESVIRSPFISATDFARHECHVSYSSCSKVEISGLK